MPLPILVAAAASLLSTATAAAGTVAAAGTAVAGTVTAAGTAVAAGAATAAGTVAAAGTAVVAGAATVAGTVATAGTAVAGTIASIGVGNIAVGGTLTAVGYVAGQKIKNDNIVEAKKRGAEHAARLYLPRINELQTSRNKFEKYYLKTESELKREMDKLVSEIVRLVKKHDSYVDRLIALGTDVKKLGITFLGRGAKSSGKTGLALKKENKDICVKKSCSQYPDYISDHDSNDDTTSSYATVSAIACGASFARGLSALSVGSMLMPVGILAAPIVFALIGDYSEYEDEHFRKECKVWEERINEEMQLLEALKKKGDSLVEKGVKDRAFYQGEIVELTQKIAYLKFRISMYKELVQATENQLH